MPDKSEDIIEITQEDFDAAVMIGIGFGYTVASEKLFVPLDEFKDGAASMLDRPILTHEYGTLELWQELRAKLEEELTKEFA